MTGIPGLRRDRNPERIPIDLELGQRHGEWRIGPISLAGVSVSRNFRDQFTAVLERSDPDSLIAELRTRNRANEAENPFEGL